MGLRLRKRDQKVKGPFNYVNKFTIALEVTKEKAKSFLNIKLHRE